MNFTKLLFSYVRTLSVLLSCLLILPADAQNNLQPADKFLPDIIVNTPYSTVNFNRTATANDNNVAGYDWSARVIESNGTVSTFNGITDVGLNLGLTLNNTNGRVSGTVSGFSGSVVRFTVAATLNNSTVERDTFWAAVRTAALPDQGSYLISLVLDASGSMSASTGSGSRWRVLQSTLRTYVPSLKNWVDNNDQLQIIHFQTGANGPVTYNNTVNFSSITNNNSAANDGILFNNNSPGGGTPLGAGIQAVANLNNYDRHAIIPFTDGYENVCPLALPNVNLSCPTITLPATTYFPIGFQGTNQQLLSDLANQNAQGQSAFALDEDAMDELFLSTIPSLFSGNTPRIVVFKRGTVPGAAGGIGQISERFRVDSLVRKLTLVLKCKSSSCRFDEEEVSLRLNGFEFPTPIARSNSEIRYHIDLPFARNSTGSLLDGGGEWVLNCPALSDTEYDLMVMVDDKYLTVETTVNNGRPVYAGDGIDVRTNAQFVGEAFNELSAEAFLLRPGEDPGSLFSTEQIDPPPPNESNLAPGMTESSLVAQAKIDALLARPDILDRLRRERRVIPLTRTADGRYTGTFNPSESEVSSHYTMVVRYGGYLSGLDSLQGMTMDHFLVRFGRPDEIRLNQVIQYVPPKGLEGVGGYQVQIRPVNKVGNPLGPAQAQNLRVEVDGNVIQLEDQLDGTYSAFARNADRNSRIRVFVLDGESPVLSRRLGAWGLSVHGGSVSPANSSPPFNTLNSGTYFEGDITYSFNQHWQVELLVGQNQFSNNFNMLEVSPYVTYHFTQYQVGRLLTPYLKGGVGYFKPDGMDGSLGLGIRGGVSWMAGQLGVYGEYGYGYVLDPDLQFSKVGLGLKYFF